MAYGCQNSIETMRILTSVLLSFFFFLFYTFAVPPSLAGDKMKQILACHPTHTLHNARQLVLMKSQYPKPNQLSEIGTIYEKFEFVANLC